MEYIYQQTSNLLLNSANETWEQKLLIELLQSVLKNERNGSRGIVLLLGNSTEEIKGCIENMALYYLKISL
jgi:hypothetical protein